MSRHIHIVDYQPQWPEEFRGLAGKLTAFMPDRAKLHHIGSTAVRGLAAKDVVDLQLTVSDLRDVDAARFAGQGFVLVPGLSDHCPPGMELPEAELTKLFFRHAGRAANLHVRQAGRFNQRYALLCRDYLRSHAHAAEAYAVIKRRLAARFPNDADAYYDIKDPVFDILMAGANDWAVATHWCEPPPDDAPAA